MADSLSKRMFKTAGVGTALAATYKKYRDGTAIGDQELDDAIVNLGPIVSFLQDLGDRFHFVWHELYNFLEALMEFKRQRARK